MIPWASHVARAFSAGAAVERPLDPSHMTPPAAISGSEGARMWPASTADAIVGEGRASGSDPASASGSGAEKMRIPWGVRRARSPAQSAWSNRRCQDATSRNCGKREMQAGLTETADPAWMWAPGRFNVRILVGTAAGTPRSAEMAERGLPGPPASSLHSRGGCAGSAEICTGEAKRR